MCSPPFTASAQLFKPFQTIAGLHYHSLSSLSVQNISMLKPSLLSSVMVKYHQFCFVHQELIKIHKVCNNSFVWLFPLVHQHASCYIYHSLLSSAVNMLNYQNVLSHQPPLWSTFIYLWVFHFSFLCKLLLFFSIVFYRAPKVPKHDLFINYFAPREHKIWM